MASYSFFPPLSAMPASPACPFPTLKPTNSSTRRFSCKAAGDSGSNDDVRLDRRDVLLGLTGAAATGGGGGLTLAAPISVCRGAPFTEATLKCDRNKDKECLAPARIIDFSPPPASDPLRVRFPAHLADPSYVAKYEKAIQAMRDLDNTDPDDPRSFRHQAAVHDAFCNKMYKYKVGDKDIGFNVHFSWLFAPWHRMYIYFFERILGKLIGDKSFALPYWNWDTPAGMALPAMYRPVCSPLYDANREFTHLNCYVDLAYNFPEPDTCMPFDQNAKMNSMIEKNLCTVYNQMKRASKTTRSFLGEKYCSGDLDFDLQTGAGTLESMAHTAVHIWTGDLKFANDMGNLATAGRDPAFYVHHANVDRMWHIWRTELGNRDFRDPDWHNTQFIFYDENKDLVRVKISDSVDIAKLRYAYAPSDMPWLDKRPKPRKKLDKPSRSRVVAAATAAVPAALALEGPLPLPTDLKKEPVKVTLDRPAAALDEAKKEGKKEVLVVHGIEINPTKFAKFDVCINVPLAEAATVGPQDSEFAGSFVNVPHAGEEGVKLKTSLRLALDELLTDIGCAGDPSVNVVLVPRSKQAIKVKGVSIELQDASD